MKIVTKFWIGIVILIILSPLGLIFSEHFKTRPATLWKAPMPDYAFKGWEEKGLPHLSFAYIISAVVGIGIITIVILAIGKILARKDDR